MRPLILTTAGLWACAAFAAVDARGGEIGGCNEACAAPGSSCARPVSCGDEPSCNQPCRPCQGVPPPQGQPPLGFFQAPPPMGTVIGPSEGAGYQGAEITFPEMRLRFPTIHFPAHFRTRTSARMVTERGVAPYVEGQSVSMGVTAQPVWSQPPTQGLTPPQPPGQGLPPPCDRPVPSQGAPPACDTRASARLDALEQEKRELELRLTNLRHALSQVSAVTSIGNDYGLAAPIGQGPPAAGEATPNLRPFQYGPPIRAPLPAVGDGARRLGPPAYVEPAAYLAEPARLLSAENVIRQPVTPGGRITGMHATH
jgi:hypothetical protein